MRGAARRKGAHDAVAVLRLRLPRCDLAKGIGDRVEGQQRRRMPGLVGAHGLEHGKLGPLALRRTAVRLQHPRHDVAQREKLLRRRADHVARHQRRGRLAKRAGSHVMGEIDDMPVLHRQIDNDGRTAEARVGLRGRVGRRQRAQAAEYPRQAQALAGCRSRQASWAWTVPIDWRIVSACLYRSAESRNRGPNGAQDGRAAAGVR